MTDADWFDALLEAGREPASECPLCGREVEGRGYGPCCDACEREDYARQRAEDERDWLEKWGAFESPREDDDADL